MEPGASRVIIGYRPQHATGDCRSALYCPRRTDRKLSVSTLFSSLFYLKVLRNSHLIVFIFFPHGAEHFADIQKQTWLAFC